MIWIDVTARAARQVRALAGDRPDLERPGLRVVVDREGTGDVPQVRLSLSARVPQDVVLPRYGFDVLVDDGDAAAVDGLRIDFVTSPEGSGFLIDRIPDQRRPTGAPPPPAEVPPSLGAGDPALREQVEQALEGVRPALQRDGGDVELVAVGEGVAYVRLEGACSGCSSALLTLSALIDTAITEAVPEVARTVLVS